MCLGGGGVTGLGRSPRFYQFSLKQFKYYAVLTVKAKRSNVNDLNEVHNENSF